MGAGTPVGKKEIPEHRVAITGARGLLGATAARVLSDVSVLDADVRDIEALKKAVGASDASWILHAAAKTDVGACERDPDEAYAVNAEGTKNVVDAARASGAHVLYISTASVFSGKEGNYRETDVPAPENVYNKSKVKGEEYILAYEKGIVLRVNLIGVHPDGSRGKNFMEWLVDFFRANTDMNAFTDVMVNPLSNWTIADHIKKIIEQGSGERILHIASSDVLSKADIIEMAAARFPAYSGTITRASVDFVADGVRRPKQMWLNCDYTKERLEITMPSVPSEIETIFAHL